MKIALTAFAFAAILGSSLVAADGKTRVVTPQPRLRLDPAKANATVIVRPAPEAPPGTATVVMENFTVSVSKLTQDSLAAAQRDRAEKAPEKFSVRLGGPLARHHIGPFAVQVGLWQHEELLKDEQKFKGQKTRVDMDVVRVSW